MAQLTEIISKEDLQIIEDFKKEIANIAFSCERIKLLTQRSKIFNVIDLDSKVAEELQRQMEP